MPLVHLHRLTQHQQALGPEYEHVGWAEPTTLEWDATIKKFSDEEIEPSVPWRSGADVHGEFEDALPVFRKKGGNSSVVIDTFRKSSSRFYHVPDDPSHARTKWETFFDSDTGRHDIHVSSHLGKLGWTTTTKTKPAAPGSIREMANVLKRHYPNQMGQAERITGARGNVEDESGRMKVYDPKIVRHLETIDFARYFDEVFT